MPKFEEIGDGFMVTVYKDLAAMDAGEKTTTQVTTQVNEKTLDLLQTCQYPQTLTGLLQRLGLRSRKHFRFAILGPAISGGLIEPTIPEKPRSRLQRYRLTAKGLQVLKETAGKRRDTERES